MVRDDARARLRDRIKYANFSRLPHRVHAWAHEASSEVASLMESLPLIGCLHTINMLSAADAKLARQRSGAVLSADPTADKFSSTFLADYKTPPPGDTYWNLPHNITHLPLPRCMHPDDFTMRRSDPSDKTCLLYTSPSPRDVEESRMPSSA